MTSNIWKILTALHEVGYYNHRARVNSCI